ncbi:hypothetical protein C7M84_019084 [Penaeus vannamei]|uniref:Uncharacterized protein n=1 Tax=Penaeus vannamei TaxID=6689 RepID=A0A3R7P7E4_PENVA|nr:hypothetical protein C7M84_019084 [Penaeus vannamei]
MRAGSPAKTRLLAVSISFLLLRPLVTFRSSSLPSSSFHALLLTLKSPFPPPALLIPSPVLLLPSAFSFHYLHSPSFLLFRPLLLLLPVFIFIPPFNLTSHPLSSLSPYPVPFSSFLLSLLSPFLPPSPSPSLSSSFIPLSPTFLNFVPSLLSPFLPLFPFSALPSFLPLSQLSYLYPSLLSSFLPPFPLPVPYFLPFPRFPSSILPLPQLSYLYPFPHLPFHSHFPFSSLLSSFLPLSPTSLPKSPFPFPFPPFPRNRLRPHSPIFLSSLLSLPPFFSTLPLPLPSSTLPFPYHIPSLHSHSLRSSPPSLTLPQIVCDHILQRTFLFQRSLSFPFPLFPSPLFLPPLYLSPFILTAPCCGNPVVEEFRKFSSRLIPTNQGGARGSSCRGFRVY